MDMYEAPKDQALTMNSRTFLMNNVDGVRTAGEMNGKRRKQKLGTTKHGWFGK